MSNPSKAKGTAAETAVVRWAREHGFPGADRQPLRGNRDQGDIGLCPGVIVEVKTSKRTAATGLPPATVLQEWLDQTELERANAGAKIGLLVVKRHGTTDPGHWHCWIGLGAIFDIHGAHQIDTEPDDWPVMLDLADTIDMLRNCGYGDSPVDPPAPVSPIGADVPADHCGQEAS